MDGSLGIVYVCGDHTGGQLGVLEELKGSKIRGLFGGREEFVAVVGGWEMRWESLVYADDPSKLDRIAHGLHDVKVCQVAVGRHHRVALSLDGQLFSWGTRDSVFAHGELGRPSAANMRLRRATPAPAPACPESDGDRAGSINREEEQDVRYPGRVLVSKDLFFTKVACGNSHSAAITDKGDLYTWGRNFEGQLGREHLGLSKEQNMVVNGICAWPKYVSAFLSTPRVVDVSCGDMFTVVLLADGSIYRFGERFVGITHTTSKDDRYASSPRLLVRGGTDGSPFTGIACGSAHTLAVTNTGEIFAWGLNPYGQLGLGSKPGNNAPEERVEARIAPQGGFNVPQVLKSNVKWSKVFAGANYSAALDERNQLFTWGNSTYGKLGHDHTKDTSVTEPKLVERLRNVFVSSVVCGERNLFAFAPTRVESISPLCGEIKGGYKLHIRGSGFWASDDLTIRFVPLTEGCLQRGSVGVFVEETGEIQCDVPRFALPGEFAVEVSMNGKHFTSNGRVFTVFKRPQVMSVSVFEARFSGGEEVALSLSGRLPEICRKPIIRFISCQVDDFGRYSDRAAVDGLFFDCGGQFDEFIEGSDQKDDQVLDNRLLRCATPEMPAQSTMQPYAMEISYDGGLSFTLVNITTQTSAQDGEITTTSATDTTQPHIIWFHDAHLLRVRPNSFPVNALPQRIEIECSQLYSRPPAELVVEMTFTEPGSSDSASMTVTVPLIIEEVVGNRIAVTVPQLAEWDCKSEALAAKTKPSRRQSKSAQSAKTAEWWRPYSKSGLSLQVRVSMNGARTMLPNVSATAPQVFAAFAQGQLLSVFPSIGVVAGGTQVSVSGDFFHFDTEDAEVCLRWRGAETRVRAVCLCPEELQTTNPTSADRRVVFMTPPVALSSTDDASAGTETEERDVPTRQEAEVVVALDGIHFTETGPRFTFCAVPEVKSVSPEVVQTGESVELTVERLVSSPSACVKLIMPGGVLSVVRAACRWWLAYPSYPFHSFVPCAVHPYCCSIDGPGARARRREHCAVRVSRAAIGDRGEH